jgi:hypothetical protein
MLPTPQTAPSPVLGALAQIGSERIAFDVPQHRKQVFILLDWKSLKPALIQMARPLGVMMSMPAHRMARTLNEVRPVRPLFLSRPFFSSIGQLFPGEGEWAEKFMQLTDAAIDD